MPASVRAIDYHLPEAVLTNEDLAREFPEWSIDEIRGKTGIAQRHIASAGECSSDLAAAAAKKLFERGVCDPEEIDFVLLCTQSPDYFLPTTACLLQHQLKLPSRAGALDINLGCSGYVYGLGMAKGLIETGQARKVLLLTAETYSKFVDRSDRSVRTLFGDGAAATLIQNDPGEGRDRIGPFVYGTDGSGAENLIVRRGGLREQGAKDRSASSNKEMRPKLYMNGPEIFTFTLRAVPVCLKQLLEKAQKRLDEIDLFVFHQANRFMLEHLREKLKIPAERFFIGMESMGNTVSATIPIALRQAELTGRIKPGDVIALVGFGVGYSWGATILEW
jgi:3-oxoacyl-[acyl-carrier-protein] synthase III